MRRGVHHPAGATLFEVVVAMALGVLVLNLALGGLQRSHAARGRIVGRIDALASFRIGRYVIRRELRHAAESRDWSTDGDSLSLRAFRGTGLVCPLDEPSEELIVSFRGDRQPDPSKDSVVLVRAGGERVLAELVGVLPAAEGCTTGPTAPARWRVRPPSPADVVLARLFERGSYHLAASALRYRRGASGRQPLTPEAWSVPPTRWTASAARIGFEYVPIAGGSALGRAGFLAYRARR